MSGLEVAAAVFGILGGFSTCARIVYEVKHKLKKRKEAKALAKANEQVEELDATLQQGEAVVREEYAKLSGRGKRNEVYDAPTQDALWSAWGILKSLESVLQPLIAQDAISDPPDFSRLQSMADQSRSLAVNSLRHVGHRMEATGSTTSLLSGTTAVTFASDAEFARKSRFNVHNVCDSALVYRENSCSFHDVAYLKTPGDYPEWSCKRCNMTMSRVQLQLSAKSPDNVWMSPSGLFKAHCTLELSNGLGPGWTCIWQKVSRDCYLRFGRQRDLLKHMKDVHVSDAARGEHTNIDWPADSRNWNAETCGYGATIGGKAMQDSRESFVIPAS